MHVLTEQQSHVDNGFPRLSGQRLNRLGNPTTAYRLPSYFLTAPPDGSFSAQHLKSFPLHHFPTHQLFIVVLGPRLFNADVFIELGQSQQHPTDRR